MGASTYPFTAIIGLAEVKRLLTLVLVNQEIGPVAILGEPGTGKSTAMRGLCDILPTDEFVYGCRSNCGADAEELCDRCKRLGEARRVEKRIPFVQMPFNAKEELLFGRPRTVKAPAKDLWDMFEPGVFALANGGIMTVDKASHLPNEAMQALFKCLDDGAVTIRKGKAKFTYMFHSVPIFEVDGPKLPPPLRRRCKLVARSERMKCTEERLMVLKRVQELDLAVAGLRKENAGPLTALRVKVLAARERLAALDLPEGIMDSAKRTAKDHGRPDSWATLVHAGAAAAALDDVEFSPALLEEMAGFLPTDKEVGLK